MSTTRSTLVVFNLILLSTGLRKINYSLVFILKIIMTAILEFNEF